MFDWEKLHPQGSMQYYPQPTYPTNPWFPNTTSPYTNPNIGSGGSYYPPPPTRPSCFESKCLNCPYKDKCKNKE